MRRLVHPIATRQFATTFVTLIVLDLMSNFPATVAGAPAKETPRGRGEPSGWHRSPPYTPHLPTDRVTMGFPSTERRSPLQAAPTALDHWRGPTIHAIDGGERDPEKAESGSSSSSSGGGGGGNSSSGGSDNGGPAPAAGFLGCPQARFNETACVALPLHCVYSSRVGCVAAGCHEVNRSYCEALPQCAYSAWMNECYFNVCETLSSRDCSPTDVPTCDITTTGACMFADCTVLNRSSCEAYPQCEYSLHNVACFFRDCAALTRTACQRHPYSCGTTVVNNSSPGINSSTPSWCEFVACDFFSTSWLCSAVPQCQYSQLRDECYFAGCSKLDATSCETTTENCAFSNIWDACEFDGCALLDPIQCNTHRRCRYHDSFCYTNVIDPLDCYGGPLLHDNGTSAVTAAGSSLAYFCSLNNQTCSWCGGHPAMNECVPRGSSCLQGCYQMNSTACAAAYSAVGAGCIPVTFLNDSATMLSFGSACMSDFYAGWSCAQPCDVAGKCRPLSAGDFIARGCRPCQGVDLVVDPETGTCPDCTRRDSISSCATNGMNCSWCALLRICLPNSLLPYCPRRCSDVSVHQCTRGWQTWNGVALSLFGQCQACAVQLPGRCCPLAAYCTELTEDCVTTCSQLQARQQCVGWTDQFAQSCAWNGETQRCAPASDCFPLLSAKYNAQPYVLFVWSVTKDVVTLLFIAALGEWLVAKALRWKVRFAPSSWRRTAPIVAAGTEAAPPVVSDRLSGLSESAVHRVLMLSEGVSAKALMPAAQRGDMDLATALFLPQGFSKYVDEVVSLLMQCCGCEVSLHHRDDHSISVCASPSAKSRAEPPWPHRPGRLLRIAVIYLLQEHNAWFDLDHLDISHIVCSLRNGADAINVTKLTHYIALESSSDISLPRLCRLAWDVLRCCMAVDSSSRQRHFVVAYGSSDKISTRINVRLSTYPGTAQLALYTASATLLLAVAVAVAWAQRGTNASSSQRRVWLVAIRMVNSGVASSVCLIFVKYMALMLPRCRTAAGKWRRMLARVVPCRARCLSHAVVGTRVGGVDATTFHEGKNDPGIQTAFATVDVNPETFDPVAVHNQVRFLHAKVHVVSWTLFGCVFWVLPIAFVGIVLFFPVFLLGMMTSVLLRRCFLALRRVAKRRLRSQMILHERSADTDHDCHGLQVHHHLERFDGSPRASASEASGHPISPDHRIAKQQPTDLVEDGVTPSRRRHCFGGKVDPRGDDDDVSLVSGDDVAPSFRRPPPSLQPQTAPACENDETMPLLVERRRSADRVTVCGAEGIVGSKQQQRLMKGESTDDSAPHGKDRRCGHHTGSTTTPQTTSTNRRSLLLAIGLLKFLADQAVPTVALLLTLQTAVNYVVLTFFSGSVRAPIVTDTIGIIYDVEPPWWLNVIALEYRSRSLRCLLYTLHQDFTQDQADIAHVWQVISAVTPFG